MTLFALLACSSSPTSGSPPATNEALPPEPAVLAAPDPHAGHSEHMAKMAETREGLRVALGPAYDAPVPGLDTADATKGRALFDSHCASCHGSGGMGDGAAGVGLNPPPADFTDAFHARYYSDAGRVRLIRAGAVGTAMVGFEAALGEQGVLDVYAYVRSLR